jgi:hypothetical protein
LLPRTKGVEDFSQVVPEADPPGRRFQSLYLCWTYKIISCKIKRLLHMNAFSVAKQSTLLTNSVYHVYIYNGTIIANFFQGGKAF